MAYTVWNCQGAQAVPFNGLNQAFGYGRSLGNYYSRASTNQTFWDYGRGNSYGNTIYCSQFTSKSYSWFNPAQTGQYGVVQNGGTNVYFKQNQVFQGYSMWGGYGSNIWIKEYGQTVGAGGYGGAGGQSGAGAGGAGIYVAGHWQSLCNGQGTGYVVGGGGGGAAGRDGSRRYQATWGGQEPSGGGPGGGGAGFGNAGPTLGGRGANPGQAGGYFYGGAGGGSGGGNAQGGAAGGNAGVAGGATSNFLGGAGGAAGTNCWVY
jgi:hypothetical protein